MIHFKCPKCKEPFSKKWLFFTKESEPYTCIRCNTTYKKSSLLAAILLCVIYITMIVLSTIVGGLFANRIITLIMILFFGITMNFVFFSIKPIEKSGKKK